MCGIAGFVCFRDWLASPEDTLNAMGQALWRRGPDNHGIQVEHLGQAGFVHRRLSIVDLSDAGNQPMLSPDGRYVLLFNGEIYNHRELRMVLNSEFPGLDWTGNSDTEVFLQAIRLKSLDWTLQNSVGMWAFALWDRAERVLFLGRDRAGEKPLYYTEVNGKFVFASDLNALCKFPEFDTTIDRVSLSAFLQTGFVPSPRSIFAKASKVPSGAYLVVDASGVECRTFWSASERFLTARADPFDGPYEEALEHLEQLIDQSIADQMLADVPVGAFLSGGIDSSLVTARMQAASTSSVKTYTIGFEEAGYNEAGFAKQVASELGTSHTEFYLQPKDALDLVPELAGIYSEPLADVAQIPMVLLSRLARQDVTVALSGDGGDELFGGYNRHVAAAGRMKQLLAMPNMARQVSSKALQAFSSSAMAEWFEQRGIGPRQVGNKAQKLAGLLNCEGVEDWQFSLLGASVMTEHLLEGASVSLRELLPYPLEPTSSGQSPAEAMMLHDFQFYMQDDVLTKVDRGTMSASLEARAPFLDHRIIEFAFSLPLEFKTDGRVGKKILRDLAYRQVPRSLIERSKSGFTVPIGLWLRGPLKEWASELLAPEALRDQGYLNVESVSKVWSDHCDGKRDNAQVLWNLLSFQSWLKIRND